MSGWRSGDVGSSPDHSSLYYGSEEEYGDGATTEQWSSEGNTTSGFSISSYSVRYDYTDKVLAWCRLVLGTAFIVVGLHALFSFYCSRWILDIRTRSAKLVLLAGASVLLSYLTSINLSIYIIWGIGWSWFWSSLILFFVTPLLLGSYLCRALRLAVVFHPRAKRALPWLIPERNYVYVLLLCGIANLAIPIYQEYTLAPWEIIPRQMEIMASSSIAFTACLACLYPFIRRVDDMFNISKELIIVLGALLVLSIGGRLVVRYKDSPNIYRWLGPSMLNFVIAAFIFFVSVIYPLHRLAMDPLAATKRDYADRVLLQRRETLTEPRLVSVGSVRGSDPEDESGRSHRSPDGADSTGSVAGTSAGTSTTASTGTGTGTGTGSGTSRGRISSVRRDGSHASHFVNRNSWRADVRDDNFWDFERLATTPLLAAAFEEFSRKALCHESVIFLSEVSRYRQGDFTAPSSVDEQTQFQAFCRITSTFIKPGSREEVNLSDGDKKQILSWYHMGQEAFDNASVEERRQVFDQAYTEVKNMLEANLLVRFLRTEEFENVRLRREHLTMMMVSPPNNLGSLRKGGVLRPDDLGSSSGRTETRPASIMS